MIINHPKLKIKRMSPLTQSIQEEVWMVPRLDSEGRPKIKGFLRFHPLFSEKNPTTSASSVSQE
jgi:hypothetical protein